MKVLQVDRHTHITHMIMRTEAALHLPHQYPPALFPGVSLICVLVHGEIQFVCIFDAAVRKLDCEREKRDQESRQHQRVESVSVHLMMYCARVFPFSAK